MTDVIGDAEAFFDSIIQETFVQEEDDELIGVPQYSELITKSLKMGAVYNDYDQVITQQIITKVSGGGYQCTIRPHKFVVTNEEEDDTNLMASINEQIYSISYRSIFEEIRSEKVRHVDCSGKFPDSVKTISEAISMSMPGETIILHRGTYKESVVLDRSLELRSFDEQSSPQDTVIDSVIFDCVVLKANCCRIVGITLQCGTPGDSYCARSSFGVLELYNCILRSSCSGCVRAEKNARITARQCQFFATNYTTTSLMPFSRSLFDSCIFHKPTNENNAIVVGSDATCLIVDSKQIDSTVVFRPHSHGMILRCNISSQVGDGVVVHDGATPLIQSSQISLCKNSGIVLQAGSKGVITGNKITNNEEFAFNARSAEKFVLNNNELSGNKGGVRVSQGSVGTLINNEIHDNENGIIVETNCRLNIRRCTVSRSKQTGVCVMHNLKQSPDRISFVRVIDSQIHSNGHFGIYCMEGSEVHAVRTSIHSNDKFGIFVKESCLVRLQDSNVYGNKSLQVHAINRSIFEATGSHFYKSVQQSVLFSEDSQGRFTNCTWEGNNLSLKLLNNSNVSLSGCHFHRNTQCVVGSDRSVVSLDHVDFVGSVQFCVMGLDRASVTMSNCSVEDSYSGVECIQNSVFNIAKSTFSKCGERALLTDGKGADVTVSECGFYTCGKSFSAHVQSCRRARLIGSTFVGATRGSGSKKAVQTAQVAVKVTSPNVAIEGCVFMNFPHYGIEVDHQGQLSVSGSKFQSCGRSALRVTNGGRADISRNAISAGHIYAVNLANSSYARISENVIGETRERSGFVQADKSSRVDARDNVNERGEQIG